MGTFLPIDLPTYPDISVYFSIIYHGSTAAPVDLRENVMRGTANRPISIFYIPIINNTTCILIHILDMSVEAVASHLSMSGKCMFTT